jgi:hypothetical protein
VKHYEPMLTEGAQEASRKVLTAAKLTRWCGAGRIQKVAHYCESDVLNTYRLWFIYEHFREKVTTIQLQFSEGQAREFIEARKSENRHLLAAVGISPPTCDTGSESPYKTQPAGHPPSPIPSPAGN